MLPTSRVVVIDDDLKHLQGLVQALSQYGTACLPIRFTGETATIPKCPLVRVIFADLHLGAGHLDPIQYFSTIGGLLRDEIRPSGPYLIILWTRYPDQANRLHNFLKDRLQGVPKPFAVWALDKGDYLDSEGNVRSIKKLIQSIRQFISQQPQIEALLNWEEQVLGAAADTVSSIMELAEPTTGDMKTSEEVGRLLAQLAAAAVGENHVAEDRFRAVNEALLPILGDRISSMKSNRDDSDLWKSAVGVVNSGLLSLSEAARINRLLHIAPRSSDDSGTARGAVISLPKEYLGEKFVKTFDLDPEEAARKQFWRKSSGKDDESFSWVLVQTQAACDYAQNQPGPLPFHLGLYMLESEFNSNRTPPAALWRSPCFECNKETRLLHVNARFQISFPIRKMKQIQPLFRLREQLLNDLIYHIHGYGARPGIVSLRGSKKI